MMTPEVQEVLLDMLKDLRLSVEDLLYQINKIDRYVDQRDVIEVSQDDA